MLLPDDRLQATVAYLQARPALQRRWVRRVLATEELAPYTVSRHRMPLVGKIGYLAMGGVDLACCNPSMREEVAAKLRAADAVTVRDRVTLAHLQACGIEASLIPDPAALVAESFGPMIDALGRKNDVGRLAQSMPQGYLALQFSAEFADDCTLDALAGQLAQVARSSGLGLVLFRAGAAPWHDDLPMLRRLAARLQSHAVAVFESLNVWDICALLARCRGYCGSSLHGRIVSMAFGRPRVNVQPSREAPKPSKQRAYVQTWDGEHGPGVVEPEGIAKGCLEVLRADGAPLDAQASRMARDFREGFERVRAALTAH